MNNIECAVKGCRWMALFVLSNKGSNDNTVGWFHFCCTNQFFILPMAHWPVWWCPSVSEQRVNRYYSSYPFCPAWGNVSKCQSAVGKWWSNSSQPRWCWASGGSATANKRTNHYWLVTNKNQRSAELSFSISFTNVYLKSGRWFGDDFSGFLESTRGFLFSFGGNNFGSSFTSSLGFGGHGTLQLHWQTDVLTVN